MAEHPDRPLGELADLANGKALDTSEYDPFGRVRVIGANGEMARAGRALTDGPTVVIGRVGAYAGVVHYCSEPVWVTDNAIVARARDGADPRFLFYAFKSLDFGGTATGSAQPLVTQSGLKVLRAPSPPLPEQRAIAKVLGDLDDKIELNRRMNETLEAMARALFKSWFVDFDPVRAKMEGRKPAFMDAETAALFPDKLVDSELGEIPAGWEVKPIGELVRAVGGSTPSTTDSALWGGPHRWIRPKDLSERPGPVLTTERTITDAGLQSISSGLLPAGTVLLSSRAPIGYVAVTVVPVAINQGFIAMVCDRHLTPQFAYHWTHANLHTIHARASGTTFPEISKAAFRPISALAPPRRLVDAFEQFAGELFQRIVSSQRESVTLAELRDRLMPRLLSGELRVTT